MVEQAGGRGVVMPVISSARWTIQTLAARDLRELCLSNQWPYDIVEALRENSTMAATISARKRVRCSGKRVNHAFDSHVDNLHTFIFLGGFPWRYSEGGVLYLFYFSMDTLLKVHKQ